MTSPLTAELHRIDAARDVRGAPASADVRRIAEIGRDLAAALDDLHARGLFHGQVSPTAVRLGGGRARLASPDDHPAPPEFRDPLRDRAVLRDPVAAARAEAANDVYGVGAVLYSLLEGGPPVCRAAAAFTRPVPPALATIVHRALADGPARYPSAAALKADLDRFLRDSRAADPASVRPETLPSAAGGAVPAPIRLLPFSPRARSRRREILARTAVLLLVLAGGLATLARARQSAEAEAPGEPPAVAAMPAAREGLAGLVDGWRAHLAEVSAAAGSTFDPADHPLLLAGSAPPATELGWPLLASPPLRRAVEAALTESTTAAELAAALRPHLGGEAEPAVLWLRDGPPGWRLARLYCAGLSFSGRF